MIQFIDLISLFFYIYRQIDFYLNNIINNGEEELRFKAQIKKMVYE